MAQTLPPECLAAIFSHFLVPPVYLEGSGDYRIVHGKWVQPVRDLKACAITCRSWSGPASDALYRHLNISNMPSQTRKQLVESLEGNPLLAPRVQALNVDVSHPYDIRITERILGLTHNITWYAADFTSPNLKYPASNLPDGRHSKLRFLAILYNRYHSITFNCEANAFAQLPPSIEILGLSRVKLPTLVLNLGRLRRLILMNEIDLGAGAFLQCTNLKHLDLFSPSDLCVEGVVTNFKQSLQSLCLSSDGDDPLPRRTIISTALTSLRHIHIIRNCMTPNELPQSLHTLKWSKPRRSVLRELLQNFSKPDYLPNLRTLPIIISDGVNMFERRAKLGNDPIYGNLFRLARESLLARRIGGPATGIRDPAHLDQPVLNTRITDTHRL